MHSSHQSRGRILFDFSCTLVIVASCAGAWMQTGATALLGAAAAAGLHGLVHLFDMRWQKPAEATEPQRIDFAAEPQDDTLAGPDAEEPPVVVKQQLAIARFEAAEQAEPVELPTKPARKAKAPRKSSSRRGTAAAEAQVAELASPAVEEVTELERPGQVDVADLAALDDVTHPHIEPLFEPDPFARMPRRAFGRRGQI